MGGHMSKKPNETSTTLNNVQYTTELNSYEAACKLDQDLQSFDTNLHARTNYVINNLAVNLQVKAMSFNSLKDVTECLLGMNHEVVKVIYECKKDIWKNQELFELVEEYFENSLKSLDFCIELGKCLKKARDFQLMILIALQQFDDPENDMKNKYAKTLHELKNFKLFDHPFDKDFFQMFKSVYKHQMVMLEKLKIRKNKLDKKIKSIRVWKKVSSMIFAATFAAVLICSVVATSIAAPPLAAALAAATSLPLGSMGKWINSLLKNYESAIKGEREVINSMHVGANITINDLDNIRVVIDKLEIEIESLLKEVDFAIDEEVVKVSIEEIKRKLDVFMKHVEDLGVRGDVCSRHIRRARTVVLQRIIK